MGERVRVAVIGAGAAGCMAAIAAAESGAEVSLLDGNEKVAKKIYATGNGRCNMTNRDQSPAHFFSDSGSVADFLPADADRLVLDFFASRGILVQELYGGYVYPRSAQAATVAQCFERELAKQHVQVLCQHRVEGLNVLYEDGGAVREREGFLLVGRGPKKKTFQLLADRVILATGGIAGPTFGCAGDGYRFAREQGLSLVPAFPSLVPILSDSPLLGIGAGVRTTAALHLLVEGQEEASETGEVQLVKDAISGIPAFALSHAAGRAVLAHRPCEVVIDFLPELSDEQWGEIRARLQREISALRAPQPLPDGTWSFSPRLEELLLGLAQSRVLAMALKTQGLGLQNKAYKAAPEKLLAAVDALRGMAFPVTGTGAADRAQCTAGGIALTEIDAGFRVRRVRGLYAAGEVLDVDGVCGGYNLTFAFVSGARAGRNAALDD